MYNTLKEVIILESHEVRALRSKVEMTQEEFAHFLGVTATTVRNWESGRHKVARLLAEGIKSKVRGIAKEAA